VPTIIHTFHGFGWQVARTANTRPWQAYTSSIKEWFYILMERYAASLCDALITVSELNKQEAMNINLAPREKFTNIYSGIDLNRFRVNEHVESVTAWVCRQTNPSSVPSPLINSKAPLDLPPPKLSCSKAGGPVYYGRRWTVTHRCPGNRR
jgi:hypothetical protein